MGWLLDAYAIPEGMAVWLIADDGRRLRVVEPWRPTAYLKAPRGEAERVRDWLEAQGTAVELAPAVRRDLMSGREVAVSALRIGNAERLVPLLAGAMRRFPDFAFYNADIAPDRLWFYETGRHPLARVRAEIEGELLRGLECLDSIWDLDYEIPPFTMLGLRAEGTTLNPAHGGRRGSIEVHLAGGEVRVLDGDDPAEMLRRLNELIREHDPDLLLTEYGDGWLLPRLQSLADECGVPLLLNRDASRAPKVSASRSYFTYGRIVHRDETWILHGRLHLDRRNSFTLDETGFDGLFETARLSRLPVQVSARTSTGTGISSMQLAQAVADGILVPVDKAQTESFKTGEELLTVDKGGLVFQPEPGVHEGVGELDFASMYPAIMVGHNLSPETVGCPCCREDGDLVPETGVRSCRRRRGLVPKVLAPLLVKRARYKVLKRTAPTEAERERAAARVAAHKWLLVCSFGYLGYRNARFGRIEAHEATTAWGREALLRAKETAEDLGYRMLHAIVDSLWVEKPAGRVTAGDCEALAAEIERRSGLPISVEGIYRWLAFLPSKEDDRRGVAQRYIGVFESGEVKARGIEARRVDTPGFVRDFQAELVEALAKAAGVAEAREIAAGLVDRVREAAATVRSGRLRGPDLAIHRHLSQGPHEYARPTPVAVAAQQLVSRGATLEAGEKVAYVLGADRPLALQILEGGELYDAEAYVELMLRAAATVLAPFGCPLASLRAAVSPTAPATPAVSAQLELWDDDPGGRSIRAG